MTYPVVVKNGTAGTRERGARHPSRAQAAHARARRLAIDMATRALAEPLLDANDQRCVDGRGGGDGGGTRERGRATGRERSNFKRRCPNCVPRDGRDAGERRGGGGGKGVMGWKLLGPIARRVAVMVSEGRVGGVILDDVARLRAVGSSRGTECDVFRSRRFTMFPIRYPQVWEMYKKAEASFWTGACERSE